MRIAIHHDDYTDVKHPERHDSSSSRWHALLKRKGFETKEVNVRSDEIFQQLRDCDGFMWRWAHFDWMHQVARRVLRIAEQELGLLVYPDQSTCWHYDDKITQKYLFEVHNIPSPRSWVWHDARLSAEWIESLPVDAFPIVVKLATGAGSSNVLLANTRSQLQRISSRLFGESITRLDGESLGSRLLRPWCNPLLKQFGVSIGSSFDQTFEPQFKYLLCQEFLASNAFDTRVTVIGKRAFAFRRFNRTNDFRASGSGFIDHDPDKIDLSFVRLAYKTSQKLRTSSCAIDGIYDSAREAVVIEVSYTYASWAVHACPGHWVLDGPSEDGELRWVPGHMWPEEAQIEDYVAKLNLRQKVVSS